MRSLLSWTFATLFLFLPAGIASAVQPQPLANLNRMNEEEPPSRVQHLGQLGDGRRVYLATSPDQGREPWVTDGTPAGTRQIADLCPGPCSLFDANLSAGGYAVGGLVLFLATDGEIWSTDGTATGTRRLGPGWSALPSEPESFTTNGKLFFVLGSGHSSDPSQLIVSDGTAHGTTRISHPDLEGAINLHLKGTVGGRVVFDARASRFTSSPRSTWVSDGTTAGTSRLDLPPLQYRMSALGQNLAVLTFYDPETRQTHLWRTGGTAATTQHFDTLEGGLSSDPLVIDGLLWLRMAGTTDRFWVSDGTAAGTVPAPPFVGEPQYVTVSGDKLFVLTRGSRSDEIWAIWRESGNFESRLLCQGCVGGPFEPFRGGVVFRVFDKVWHIQASPPHTRLIVHLDDHDLHARDLKVLPLDGDDHVFVTGLTTSNGQGLLVSDGQEGGAEVVLTVEELPHSLGRWELSLDSFYPTPGGVVFPSVDVEHGKELWGTDGTVAGTRLLADVSYPLGDLSSEAGSYRLRNDLLYFIARVDDEVAVAVTDGTPAGTRVAAILDMTFEDTEMPTIVGWAGDLVIVRMQFGFLWAADPVTGRSVGLGTFGGTTSSRVGDRLLITGEGLVRTDGTRAGTTKVEDLELTGLAQLDGERALAVGWEYSPDPEDVDRRGLWRLGGDPGDRELVLALEGDFGPIISHDGLVYFVQRPDTTEGDLIRIWRSDGTAGGTAMLSERPGSFVRELVVAGSRLFYFGSHFETVDLSTREVTRLPYQGIGHLTHFSGQRLHPMAGGLLFIADVDGFGWEPLWTDGTPAGTRVLDLVPGRKGSKPRHLTVHGERAYLFAEDSGRIRLAETDGTTASTRFIDSPHPDLELYVTRELAVVGDHLVFTARGRGAGREPWALSLAELEEVPPTPEPVIPTPPVLRATVLDDGGVRVEWQPPDRGGVDHYVLESRRYHRDRFASLIRSADTLSYERSAYQAATPAVWRVRAVNTSGSSDPSNEVATIASPFDGICDPEAHLCLADGRFRLRAFWRDHRNGDAAEGTGTPLPGSDRAGVFWFFREENVEIITKVLDGDLVNGHHWIFAGGLTDLEYFLAVDDVIAETRRLYRHPAEDLCGLADISALPAASSTAVARVADSATPGGPIALSLLDDRYRVTVSWRDQRTGNTGAGTAVPGSDNTGYFWFFRPENIELVIKVLDGEPVNGHHWVFYGGITDLEYDLLVEDLANGESRSYHHAPGDLCGGADTTAFDATE